MKKILIIFILLISSESLAFEKKTNFTFEKFKNSQKNGETIVIISWNKNCSRCAAQSKILVNAANDFKKVKFFFYEQTKYKNIANFLNIKFWSTIVVYKGENEIAREIGLNNKDEIYKIIKKGI